MDQALIFEQMMTEIHTIVQFECTEEVILSRLLGRMESTPVHLRRDDDKPDVIKDRVRTYFAKSKPATDFYLRLGKVKEVEAVGSPNEVTPLISFLIYFRFLIEPKLPLCQVCTVLLAPLQWGRVS